METCWVAQSALSFLWKSHTLHKGGRTERTFSLARDKTAYTSCAILGLYQGQVVGLKEQGHHPGIAQVDLSMTLPGSSEDQGSSSVSVDPPLVLQPVPSGLKVTMVLTVGDKHLGTQQGSLSSRGHCACMDTFSWCRELYLNQDIFLLFSRLKRRFPTLKGCSRGFSMDSLWGDPIVLRLANLTLPSVPSG